MSTTVGVITFPGSNDDHDARRAIEFLGGRAERLWHKDPDLQGVDAVILPGGFSYGDYLRTGALARFSPVLQSVRAFAESGGPVLGICNGFQILCESHLLPGALIRNKGLRFVCRWVNVRVENTHTAVTHDQKKDTVLRIPVKHGEGQWVASDIEITRVEDQGLVVLRYCDEDGRLEDTANPNGSVNSIAGLTNEAGNVVGMMPHPEHAIDPDLGPVGGAPLLTSLLERTLART